MRRTPAFVVLLVAAALVGCGAPADEAPTRVGFVLVGARDDLGYNQAVWEGSLELARAFPDVEVLRREDVPEDATAVTAMEEMIADGATILFATSFGHLAMAREVAQAHPDVVVLHQGGLEGEPALDNLGTYFGAHAEAAWGAGVAAGAATASGRLGFVVAFPIPATHNNVNAFLLGARSVAPDATVDVVFTRDWCDPDAQLAAARTLVARGVDVIAQHQDCTRTILEFARDEGIRAVGYHADGSEVAGEAWLLGAVWTWGDVYRDIVDTVLRGRFVGSAYDGDFRGTVAGGDNPFVLTEPGPTVTAEVAARIAADMDAFASGRTHVFAGPLRDRDGRERVPAGGWLDLAAIDRMDWFVDGVVVVG